MAPTSPTERFRRQHAELAGLAGEVLALIEAPAAIARDSQAVRRTLAVLAGKLKIHAAMEDEALYPSLFDHADVHLRETARSFRAAFGDVYGVFFQFLDRWPAEAISANPEEFVRQTRAAMAALGERVKAENEHLYEMIDERLAI